MHKVRLPHHVFISYSRKDIESANRVRAALRDAGIDVWLDDEIQPGTPNYEKSIRKAIHDALAVVLLASPNSAQSEFVAGEIAIAESRNVPVYPIWIAGQNWADSALMKMSMAQYTDVRDREWSWGIHVLTNALNNLKDAVLPRFFLHQSGISIPFTEYVLVRRGEEGIALRHGTYKTILDFINALFIHFLEGQHLSTGEEYLPAYGSQWVLAPSPTIPGVSNDIIRSLVPKAGYVHWRPPRRLLVPWSWLANTDPSAPLASYDRKWYASSLTNTGLLNANSWEVIEHPYALTEEIVIGVAGPDPLAYTNPRYLYSLFDYEVHRKEFGLRVTEPSAVVETDYSATAVYVVARRRGWPSVDWQSFNLKALITTDWKHHL